MNIGIKSRVSKHYGGGVGNGFRELSKKLLLWDSFYSISEYFVKKDLALGLEAAGLLLENLVL